LKWSYPEKPEKQLEVAKFIKENKPERLRISGGYFDKTKLEIPMYPELKELSLKDMPMAELYYDEQKTKPLFEKIPNTIEVLRIKNVDDIASSTNFYILVYRLTNCAPRLRSLSLELFPILSSQNGSQFTSDSIVNI